MSTLGSLRRIALWPRGFPAAGYRTGAVVANSSALNRQLGFDQGFGFIDDRPGRTFGYSPLLNGDPTPFPLQSGWVTNPYRLAEEITDTAGRGSIATRMLPSLPELHGAPRPLRAAAALPRSIPGRSLFLLSPEGDVLRDILISPRRRSSTSELSTTVRFPMWTPVSGGFWTSRGNSGS